MGSDRAATLARTVTELLGDEVDAMTSLRGGDVAESYRVELDSGRVVFAKTHHDSPPGFFTTEAAGLEWLRGANAMPVPEVLAVSDGSGTTVPALVLEWIDEAPGAEPDDAGFGRALAALHATGAPVFGRNDRRTTGSRRLPNEPCATWNEFYATQRLLPLAHLMFGATHLGVDVAAALGHGLESVAERIAELSGEPEPPARLHGDLWGGNRLVDRDGRSWLIDPACFGGHREFDLAMMRLFGGFGRDAFAAYSEIAPLASGWQDRIALHHLAPLAVHAIKFGHGYVPGLRDALDKLGAVGTGNSG